MFVDSLNHSISTTNSPTNQSVVECQIEKRFVALWHVEYAIHFNNFTYLQGWHLLHHANDYYDYSFLLFFSLLDFKNKMSITCLQMSWNSRIRKPIKHLRRSVCAVFKSSFWVVCRSIHTIARQLHSIASIKRRWLTFFYGFLSIQYFCGVIIIICMQSAWVLGTRPWASIRFSFIRILK